MPKAKKAVLRTAGNEKPIEKLTLIGRSTNRRSARKPVAASPSAQIAAPHAVRDASQPVPLNARGEPIDGSTYGRGKPGPGGTPGVPRMRTVRAKEAISHFVDQNVGKFQEWIDAIVINDGPLDAMKVVVDLVEYCVPKLARTEVRGEMRNTVVLEDSRREELLNFLLKRAGVAQLATKDDADKSIN